MAKGKEISYQTIYGKSSDKIGDFTNLYGTNVDDILDRIPDAKYFNPNGEFFDEIIVNNSHIPIESPY